MISDVSASERLSLWSQRVYIISTSFTEIRENLECQPFITKDALNTTKGGYVFCFKRKKIERVGQQHFILIRDMTYNFNPAIAIRQ